MVKMPDINIKIPYNLTEQEEIGAIARQLFIRKKQLQLSQTSKKLIASDTAVKIKDIETKIIVTRDLGKPIPTCTCSVCKTIIEKRLAKVLWINYGGVTKKHHYCSEECRNIVLNISGNGRAAIKKSELRHAFNY
jgi:hypothetical protein